MNKVISHFAVITIFMCGDVMTGRGIDQVLPHPSDSRIYEAFVKRAEGYVELAEKAHGPIPKPVSFSYIWGDALRELERMNPDVRIINLETSVTRSDDYWKHKGINYRMHPENISILAAANIDAVSLANNHVLDWGYEGLTETLATLTKANISSAGAGTNLKEAGAPAILQIPGKGRVIVFSFGSLTSGIPHDWAATDRRPGVHLLNDLSDDTIDGIKEHVNNLKKTGDILIASIHWGSNWGFEVPSGQRAFAHKLIDTAGIDIVHGHSSHHIKGIEVYRGRPIIYGAGDFINDYEGIGGHEEYRSDLGLMYFVSMDAASGTLVRLRMVPTQVRNFKIHRASRQDSQWLTNTLNREGEKLGTRVARDKDNSLRLRWDDGK